MIKDFSHIILTSRYGYSVSIFRTINYYRENS